MSQQDEVKPYHAKDAAPGQEAADVVAEVLQHAAQRDQASKAKLNKPTGPPKWALPLTAQLFVLALYFLIAQPDWLIVNPIEERRPIEERLDQGRSAIYFDGIIRIDGFFVENGRLPETLDEAHSTLASQGVDYTVRGDSSYLLILTIDTETIVYDSSMQTAADFVPGLAASLPG